MSWHFRTMLSWVLAALLIVAAGCPDATDADRAATSRQESPSAAAAPLVPAADASVASPAPAAAPDLATELASAQARWVETLGPGHGVAVQSPFVVAINGDARLAHSWLTRTVAPAAERLHKQFMKARPDRAVTILLFTDQDRYRKACRDLLHVADPPYYGFYRPAQRLLVMDISTGGGTLVHELTHALIAFDFPDIPDWFNEGLGSLFEQCRFEDDRLVGMVNWRLPALRNAIRDGTLGTIGELTRTDFRGARTGLNYAHARYLCLYMQQQGCLESFYRDFRDGACEDPTGLRSLRKAFAPRTLEEVDRDFRRWVAGLRRPVEN